MNLGIYQALGKLDQALASTIKSLELKPDNLDAHENLGCIYKDLGKLDQASHSPTLEVKPNNSTSSILEGSTKPLANLIRLAHLNPCELKPDNPIAHMNLVEFTVI